LYEAVIDPGVETVIVPLCDVESPLVDVHTNNAPELPEIGEIHENEIEEPGVV
jgi:hypothetical protein